MIEHNASDRVVTSDIKKHLNRVLDPFNELADKVNEKQNVLNACLLQTQEFQEMYSDCLDQMTELELRLGKLDPLSVLHNRLKKQDEEFSAYEIDVTQVRYRGVVFLTVLNL